MKKIFLILTSCLFLSSCATIMRENNQSIPIKSNLDQVNIQIFDKNNTLIFSGKTPTTVNLKTSKSGYFNPQKYKVVASKAGYPSITTEIDWHVSGWYYIGNLFIGGLVGYLIIDPITGDMYYLDEEVNLNMP